MQSLADKIVLITGAAGGFGQAMIRQFLQEGCYLVLTDLSTERLLQVAAQIAAQPNSPPLKGKILGFIAADLSTATGCDALYTQCMAITPTIDILINNAGIAYAGLISDIPQAKWEQLLQINLLAPLRLTAQFLPQMIARRSGHIVNISSVAGLVGVPGLSIYSTSKFGLRGFSEALAGDLAQYNIAVTAIYPYFARTPILQAERFGNAKDAPAPPFVYDPEFVIAELIAGIRQRKLHIYPGALPRQIDLLRRIAPWALPLLTRPNRNS